MIERTGVLLTVMFVGFKIAGIIDWNWILIVTPYFASAFIAGCGRVIAEGLK